ncbi:hypothetical protein SAMN03097708_02420 [Thiohalomonas denitrificans]|uniref:Uncharacterized protein n=1 Tax=Thiohalomonas denitrificans TaxID=415747 RepID=A0A1G5QMY1_9GAMM|nr:hypothetical protein SAMN03097708_02420 [Thiohalomonas denitrificans]
MQQVAGSLVFIAVVGPGRFQCRQTVEARTFKNPGYCALPNTDRLGNLAVGLALSATGNDLPDEWLGRGQGAAARA